MEDQEIDRRFSDLFDKMKEARIRSVCGVEIGAGEKDLREVGRDMARNVASRAKEWQREAVALVESREFIPRGIARKAFKLLRAIARDPLVEDWEG